jgi:diguanylate cyclase (GGDEF)-like protein
MRRLCAFVLAVLHLALIPAASRIIAQQSLPLPDHPRYGFQHLSEQLSLSTATVTCLAQDQQGFLWIGTQNGLFRYDGSTVTQFSAAQGLNSIRIDQMFVSPRGDLWVATDFGIWRYVRGRFEPLRLPSGHKVSGLLQFAVIDSSDHAYVVVEDGIILRINVDHPDESEKVKSEPVTRIFRAPDDSILVAWKNKVGRIPKGGISVEPLPGELPDSPVHALLVDGAGNVWARTPRHFSRFDQQGKRWIPDDAGLPGSSDFGYPTVDGKGEILLPTIRGLFRRIQGRWQAFGTNEGMATDAVFAAIEDREGAIWIGFGGGGVERWPGPSEWLGWSTPEGLPDSVVWATVRDRDRRLWLATNDGLAMWAPQQHRWRVWRERDGLAGSTVRRLVIGGDNTLWALSVPGGITRVDLASLSLRAIKSPDHPNARVPSYVGIVATPTGGIWASGAGFIDQYKSQGGSLNRTSVALPHDVEMSVSTLSFAKDGVLWGAGRGGVSRFDGKTWQHFTARDGLLMDSTNGVWAVSGTEAWASYFEPKGVTRIRIKENGGFEFKHFTMRDGLSSDSVYLTGSDRDGNVWLGGDRGLSVLHPDGTITTQDRSSGLLWNDVSAEAFYEDADGGIFIGTSRGLSYRRPKVESARSAPSETVITSATFAGKELVYSDSPQVPYDEGTFEAHFSIPALGNPSGLGCKYQLYGLERAPVETTFRQVRYTALPAGNYKFEVSCGSVSRGWSPPADYSFMILPPWWQRLWARALFGFLLVLAMVWIVSLRTRTLERQRQRLEEAVAARSFELQQANNRFEEASLTDPLTGVHNRRFFEVTVPRDVQQTIRAYQTASPDDPPRDRDLAFFLVDLDHFKSINDTYGHTVGDKVLVEAAQRLNSVIRETDVLVRWGGEEFLIVSQGTNADGAQLVARRILDEIGDCPFEVSDGNLVRKTCSIGWAIFPWIGKVPVAVPVEEIIKLADRALYQAKQGGRNCGVGYCADERLEDSPIGEQKANPKVVRQAGPQSPTAKIS